ncbi:MAG: YbaB/EbfC family nucleoid-associated protein [Asticcacaulis sp.]|nr:YbaB/EbfC family nucleoid-associated protein [Asticcacaulis sp.]
MDFQQMMKQAQLVQQKLHEAEAKLKESVVHGSSGGGLVTLELKGAGDMTVLNIDDSLMAPGEGEVLADLIRAAYADARKKLDDLNARLMQEAASTLGPNAGMPHMPKFF